MHMDTFGAVVVAEVLEASADFVDANPKRAAASLRKIGAALRARVVLNDHEQAERRGIEAINAARGRGHEL